MLKTVALKICQQIKRGAQMVWMRISYLAISWPKAFAAAVVLLFVMYYPLGGTMIEKIDKTSDYDLSAEGQNRILTVDLVSTLINREVNEHIWVSNLPLFFPSYFLDNMPSFQNGIISTLAKTTGIIERQVKCPENEKIGNYLEEAATLLKYPGNVWMFAADNKLKIAPSSSSQYRKARKRLRDFNRAFPESRCFWNRNTADLQQLIRGTRRDLNISAEELEVHVNENSSDWFDGRSDNLFYYNQGKIYTYMLLFKTLGRDFKEVLVRTGQYENWTKAIRAMQDASDLSPTVVRNGDLNSIFAANQLMTLGYYIMRADNILGEINLAIGGVSTDAN